MTIIRPDFLKECMSDVGQAPLDEFNKAFCVRCLNPECVRSGGNSSLFNKRISNWRETMFERVPRAAEGDSRYDKIRAKRFLPIGEPRPHAAVSPQPAVIAASRMPKPRSPEPEKPEKTVEVPPPRETVLAAPIPVDPVTRAPEPTAAQTEPVQPQAAPRHVGDLQNTPFVQGTVLKGGDPVERPGSTFTFDDE